MTPTGSQSAIGQFELQSSIPVLPMFDEALSKAFYVEYLGYEIDWEHRFRDSKESPLYMQVHQGASVLHLNGHADKGSPTCQVRIPVTGLQHLCDLLCSKKSDFLKPVISDPRHQGKNTDMTISDPSGNQLVFWLAEKNHD